MLTYAVTYADVCWRMLMGLSNIYTVVCVVCVCVCVCVCMWEEVLQPYAELKHAKALTKALQQVGGGVQAVCA